jgi:hypothetical protein
MSKPRKGFAVCPKCEQTRKNNSPVSYVWWHVKGHGLMCYDCYDKHEAQKRHYSSTAKSSRAPAPTRSRAEAN